MKTYEAVEDIKRPLVKGEILLVPCIVKRIETDHYDEIGRIEIELMYITPIYNHPHNDVENGQKETHYHTDYRFVRTDKNGHPINRHKVHRFVHEARPRIPLHGDLEYILLPVINPQVSPRATSVQLIGKSKLKHKCIHKGKCPHRGYDLSQEVPVDGVITCPLHGLKFNNAGKIINM